MKNDHINQNINCPNPNSPNLNCPDLNWSDRNCLRAYECNACSGFRMETIIVLHNTFFKV